MIAEALLPIVDRLIALIKERKAINKDIFVQVVEPLFTPFENVAENYIFLFQEIGRVAAEAPDVDTFRRAFHEFQVGRRKSYAARRAVESLASTYSLHASDEQLRNLFEKLRTFFYTEGSEESMSRSLEGLLDSLIQTRIWYSQERLNPPPRPQVPRSWSPYSAAFTPAGSFSDASSRYYSEYFSYLETARFEHMTKMCEEMRQRCLQLVEPNVTELGRRWKALQSGFAVIRMRFLFSDRLTKL